MSKLRAYLTYCYLNVVKLYKLNSGQVLVHVIFFSLTEEIVLFNDAVVQEQGIY